MAELTVLVMKGSELKNVEKGKRESDPFVVLQYEGKKYARTHTPAPAHTQTHTHALALAIIHSLTQTCGLTCTIKQHIQYHHSPFSLFRTSLNHLSVVYTELLLTSAPCAVNSEHITITHLTQRLSTKEITTPFIRYHTHTHRYKTKVINNNLNPEWNETFVFKLEKSLTAQSPPLQVGTCEHAHIFITPRTLAQAFPLSLSLIS